MSWEKDDAWNKKSGSRRPRGRGHHTPTEKPDSDSTSTWEKSRKKADKRQKRRTLGWLVGGVFLVILIAIAALPTVAGILAPGIVASKVSDAITGRAEVEKVSLGWFAGQHISGLKLYDTDGTRRSDVDIKIEKGLFALALAGGNYGNVAISGSLDVSPNNAGDQFTQHTVGPTTGQSTASPTTTKKAALPKGFRVTLRFDDLQIQYADPAAQGPVQAVRLDDIAGSIQLDAANKSKFDIRALLTRKLAGDAIFKNAGSIKINATATDFADKDGSITPDALRFDATLKTQPIETRIAEMFANQQGRLSAALGQTVELKVTAEGSASAFNTVADFTADAATIHAPLAIDLNARTIASTQAITASLDTERLSHILPDRDKLLGPEADANVTTFPTVALNIDQFRMPIPGEAGIDLSKVGAQITAEIGRLVADIKDPTTAGVRTIGFEPATISIAAADLSKTVTIDNAIETTIDAASSGILTVDLTASGLIDDAGAINTTNLPGIDGTVRAQRLALAAFQPIAMAAGFDLVGVLGETADLTINAKPQSDQSTSITIAGTAPHANIDGAFTLNRGNISTQSTPLTIRLSRPGPAIAGLFNDAGVRITDASGLSITLAQTSIDFGQIAEGDLSSIALDLTATIDRIDANLVKTGESVSSQGLTASIQTAGLADGLKLTAANRISLEGQPAGGINADFTVAGILDAAGALVTAIPTNINGTLKLANVRTAALAGFAPIELLDLPRDLGQTLDATITASPASDNRVLFALNIASQNLNGFGSATAGPDGIRADGEALALELTGLGGPGGVLQRFITPKPGAAESPLKITTTTPGKAVFIVRNLSLPLDPASITTAGKADINLSIIDLGLSGESGYAGTVESLAVSVAVRPDTDPAITFNGRVSAIEAGKAQAGTISGSIKLANAFLPADASGRLPIAPNGTIKFKDLPTQLARLIDKTFPDAQGKPGLTLHRAITDSIGNAVSLEIKASRETDPAKSSAAPLTINLDGSAGQSTLKGVFTLAPADDGAFKLTDTNADAYLPINQQVFRTAMSIAAPATNQSGMTISNSGALDLKVRNQRGTLQTTATLSKTTVAGLSAPGPNNVTRTLVPLTLAGTANFDAPFALLADPAGTHAVTLNADFSGTDPSGTPVLNIAAIAAASLTNSAPAGDITANVRVNAKESAWLDALAGTDGLLVAAMGDRVELSSDLKATFAPPEKVSDQRQAGLQTATATAAINAPYFSTNTPAAFTINNGVLSLSKPLAAVWKLTPELFNQLAPAEPGKAAQLILAAPASLTITADKFSIPLEPGKGAADIKLDAKAPEFPLRLHNGSTYALRDFALALSTMADAGKGKLRITAATEDQPRAIDINTTITGLPSGDAAFDATRLAIDGVTNINALPMHLIDALAAGDGHLVDLLGQTLSVESSLTNLPQQGGTIMFRAVTPQSTSRLAATVKPHPNDQSKPAIIIDEPMVTQITHFDYDFAGKKLAIIPVFGSVKKIEKTHRPATITISKLVAPVDGDMTQIIMQGTVDPGVIEYDFEQGIGTLLKIAKQRTQANAGERLEPFTITMNDGIARIKDLTIPLGEFSMTGRARFDLVRGLEDITVGIPAGAFAGEIIGNLPGAASGLLKESIIIPVRRQGRMGEQNKWVPDFESVIKDLFSPENILDNVIKGGLKDFLGGG